MATLQLELQRRDEKMRKLELQLRGAYSGINRALRSSGRGRPGAGGLRDSLRSDTDDFSEIGEDQNIFELHVTEAQIYVSMTPFPYIKCTTRCTLAPPCATQHVAAPCPQCSIFPVYTISSLPVCQLARCCHPSTHNVTQCHDET